MKSWLKSVFSRTKGAQKTENREVSRTSKTSMFQVMERVDKQVGRAVTRLSER